MFALRFRPCASGAAGLREEAQELGALRGSKGADRLVEHVVEHAGARGPGLLAVVGEPVQHDPAGAGFTPEKTAVDHPLRKLAHRLVGLERELREPVQRRIGFEREVAKHVPLHERQADWCESSVALPVMPPLQPLHGETNVLERSRHVSTISGTLLYYGPLYKVPDMTNANTLTTPEQRTTTVDVGGVPITATRAGTGRPVLLLHGGGGPMTVLPWGVGFAAARNAEVIVPVHPGFNGTPRPESLRTPHDLAELYVRMLGALELEEVTVVGNSIGGWIAAEIAALGSSRVSAVVLVDAVGLVVPGHPYVDFYSLTPAEVAARSYHDPERFGVDPSKLPLEAQAAMAGNRATLATYGGDMTDPTLASRLPSIDVPVLVVWGAADRIGDPEVGEAYAELVPGARLEVISDAGHLPQIETPSRLTELVGSFADLR
ncbi:MAG: hypothetical protein QOE85_1150 [Actinomycetota bacterium]|nr:hypothetical protein [Actinomycetota bacterium]